ncbi:MAG: universal stress protein [Pirellulales bacterium]|nr:universal stress protein [Pirellulales bacterium]
MKILLAVDGSPCSNAAVEEVCRRPWPPDTEVHVVTVHRPAEPSLLKSSPTIFDELVKQQRSEALGHLTAAVETLEQRAPGLRVMSLLLEGLPKDAILDEAERWDADLIVVGSHGYSPVRRFLLGSVSLAVATGAPCSVQIVRGPVESAANGSHDC